MRNENKKVLSFMCHPDDTEFMAAGTLALLKDAGWDVAIATMTAGDCGSKDLSREQISDIRRDEASKAASLLGGEYFCAGLDDVFVMYDKPSLLKTIEIIRKVRPAIVFTASPQDYFIDHENTSSLVRTACFSCSMPNVRTPGIGPHDLVPHLYYADPIGDCDIYGEAIKPSMYVDISDKIEIKEKMLSCHESQRKWLLAHHGMDEYILSMKRTAQKKGQEAGFNFAEGFRQHLGHAYPANNILEEILQNLVK